MHIRVVRSGDRQYAQLVESYRREKDGMPATRVIRGLGDPNSIEVHNLRVALEASRKSKRVVLDRSRASNKSLPQPVANLRYLDLAVLRELWNSWGLDDVLDTVVPAGNATVPASSVVAALAIQRCVDPGSKLYATEWIPRTALPLLLGWPSENVDNTRIHRVLDALDRATPRLMPRLIERYRSPEGAFASLFLDATDTWFVGNGPSLAARAKTKEGRVERKVGIVLLCNEQGYPMRWEVIGGRESEVTAMSRMLHLVSGLPWAQRVPLVCDRAMGRTAQIREMLAANLHFVTALTRTEYDAYSDRIPHQALAGIEPGQRDRDECIIEAARLAESAGMQRAEDHLFVLDLGVVERVVVEGDLVEEALSPSADDGLAKVMQLARSIDDAVASGRYTSHASAALAHGLSKQVASNYRILRRLSEPLQQQTLDGKARGRSLQDLIRIARLDDEQEQAEAFAALVASPAPRRPSAHPLGVTNRPTESTADAPPQPIRVRAVLYFNPQLFVDQRLRAARQLQAVQAFADDLNVRLASPRSRMHREQIAAAVDRYLRKDNLIEAFDSVVSEQKIAGTVRYQVQLRLDQSKWSRRRRYDGFNMIVAHPDVTRAAADLCRLYRAKDAVEKDFQTIKSLIQLRPVRHQTDTKVRAHVTICMLALLLERTLERKLAGLHSPQAALQILGTTHLNRYAGSNGAVAHVVTRTDSAQDKILRRLRLQHLADYAEIVERVATN